MLLPRFCVPSMIDSLEVEVLYPARWRRRACEAQGRRREVSWEGSRGSAPWRLIRPEERA